MLKHLWQRQKPYEKIKKLFPPQSSLAGGKPKAGVFKGDQDGISAQ
jgi:hypothetical protein